MTWWRRMFRVVEGPLFDEDFVRAHQDEMQRAYDLLADDLSREVFLDTVRFKLSGKMKYLRHSESDKDEVFHNLLRPTAEEHFSDLGAYNGDTIRELLHYTDGKFASVTALEPDRRSFRKLNEWRVPISRAMLRSCRRARGTRTRSNASPIRQAASPA